MSEEAKWYVVHTYSGYENKVATNIEKAVENRGMHELIQEVKVPTETVTEIKDNKKREVERKIFPGYVLIKMIMTDESWYIVRNTRGCTGFVGPSSKPIPLTEKEVAELIKEARSFGDLSENSEYDEAKNEQGKLYSRIAELEEILSNYTLIQEQENHMDLVHVGNTVVVRDLEFDEQLQYQIVGSQEADPMNGRISEDSPFGRALLGRKAGEEVVVEAPAGNIRYQIVEIQR